MLASVPSKSLEKDGLAPSPEVAGAAAAEAATGAAAEAAGAAADSTGAIGAVWIYPTRVLSRRTWVQLPWIPVISALSPFSKTVRTPEPSFGPM